MNDSPLPPTFAQRARHLCLEAIFYLSVAMLMGAIPLLLYAFEGPTGALLTFFCVAEGAPLVLLLLAVLVWFTIIFFRFARYSLRTLLLVILAAGFCVALLFQDSPVLVIVGILGLALTVVRVFKAIVRFDPAFQEPPPR